MDAIIQELNYGTDETTKQLLQKLVEKKQKFETLKKRHHLTMWLTTFFSFLYFFWLYKHIAIPYSHSFASMFRAYIEQNMNLYVMLFLIGFFGFMNVLKQKTDKAEKEFHDLRCEIIDKSKDLWNSDEGWGNRHLIFQMMKKKYDINLFHQAK